MLNSLALQLSGITKDFKITDGGPGKVELDPPTGEPTGLLRELGRFVKIEAGGEDRRPRSRRTTGRCELFRDYNSVGLHRGLRSRRRRRTPSRAMPRCWTKGDLPVRVHVLAHLQPPWACGAPSSRASTRCWRHPLVKGDHMLRIIGTKILLDGGMLTGSAYMREPWGVSKIYWHQRSGVPRHAECAAGHAGEDGGQGDVRRACSSPRTASATARCMRCSMPMRR